MRRIAIALLMTAALVIGATPALAHVHVAEESGQPLANGQNHPGFQAINEDGLRESCEGVLEPANAGPAGYGLETAHHGPDAGDPGRDDGCYAVVGNPTDGNPGID